MPLTDIVDLQGHTPEELEAAHHDFSESASPYKMGAWFQAKNIYDIALCQLGEIMGVGDYDTLTKEFKPVIPPNEEGPWILSTSAELFAKIQSLTDEEVQGYSESWSQTEDMRGASQEALAAYLNGLRAFLKNNPGPFYLVLSL